MYRWIDFYSFLFMFAGLLAAAIIKWRALRESQKMDYDSSSDFMKMDAFAWWGFFSLTVGGMLIPIFEKTLPILNRYLTLEEQPPHFSHPGVNAVFVIFFTIGGLIMTTQTEKLSMGWMVNPDWPFDYGIFYPFLFPWMIFQYVLRTSIPGAIFYTIFFFALLEIPLGIPMYILFSAYISQLLLSIGFIKLGSEEPSSD